MKRLVSHRGHDGCVGVFNDTTSARVILDMERMNGYIWLLAETEEGWIEYNMPCGGPEA